MPNKHATTSKKLDSAKQAIAATINILNDHIRLYNIENSMISKTVTLANTAYCLAVSD